MKIIKNCCGSTPIEILTVTVILGLVAGITVPALKMLMERNAIIEEVSKKKTAPLDNTMTIWESKGAVISPDGMTTGIVTVGYYNFLRVLKVEDFGEGSWSEALSAKFLYWDADFEKFRPLKSVE